ncbi:MAG: prolyl oligopeptidase family serine peptidase [Candidatus Sphingomonas colombiensis]|nr:prolyl oligopeptidase family serine peptidase [Sphingomonas sp.]WEK43191.1 MAG: prolyl oligopeptidase family serine peptidase [Sphingomonas sp.]
MIVLLATAASPAAQAQATAAATKHLLTLDDILDVEHLEGASYSPDGAWVAAAVQRSARYGEVYGRTAYEIDPSRSDIWLISTRTGERKAITSGVAQAAGYWCATWSPDGQRLAMLSTQPEGAEPRGGDNVRLYLWERQTGKVRRMASHAVMTQTRYSSPLYQLDLRGGGDKGSVPHTCNNDNENAPFLWLDDHRLLVVALPNGQISGLIDNHARPFRTLAEEASRLHDGKVSTVHAVSSGAARRPDGPGDSVAILRIVDVATGENRVIAEVPAYPFRGGLSLVVAPDGRQAAVLATLGALQPAEGRLPLARWGDYWTVERKFGFVSLTPDTPVRWVTMPPGTAYPLELYDWSPEGGHIALRGRADPFATTAPLFIASPSDGAVRRLTQLSVGAGAGRTSPAQESPVVWADDRHLVVRLSDDTAPNPRNWWLLALAGKQIDLTNGGTNQPAGFRRDGTGGLVTVSGSELLRLDTARAKLAPIATLPTGASIAWPRDPRVPTATLLLRVGADERTRAFQRVSSSTGKFEGEPAPHAGDLLDVHLESGRFLTSQSGRSGLQLRDLNLRDASARTLLALDAHLAHVNWGETRLIDYQDSAGTPLKAAVILPPDYRAGQRYPTLLWVYQGYRVQGLEGDYSTDPFMPGLYNLYLYAAKGYVILMPSMPFQQGGASSLEAQAAMLPSVTPAIDRLVELGIADPARLGVMGQSRGGYSVYSLVTRTSRFKAAVAMAGISNLSTFYQLFDPTAYGYPGIEHEKSDNWVIIRQFNLDAPPTGDEARYARNSPINFAGRVTTPLLMVHGSADTRGSGAEAEEFFYALYDQGKTARLLRYGGESHSLAQSPANIRDIFSEMIAWFDRYVKDAEAGESTPERP